MGILYYSMLMLYHCIIILGIFMPTYNMIIIFMTIIIELIVCHIIKYFYWIITYNSLMHYMINMTFSHEYSAHHIDVLFYNSS